MALIDDVLAKIESEFSRKLTPKEAQVIGDAVDGAIQVVLNPEKDVYVMQAPTDEKIIVPPTAETAAEAVPADQPTDPEPREPAAA